VIAAQIGAVTTQIGFKTVSCAHAATVAQSGGIAGVG
jgi:hypothetical protein